MGYGMNGPGSIPGMQDFFLSQTCSAAHHSASCPVDTGAISPGLSSTAISLYGLLHSATKTKKLHGLSPRANYIDRATAVCRRSDCQLLRIRVPRGQRGGSLRPYSRFSRQEPLLREQICLYALNKYDSLNERLFARS
jgi:hypothetical protein